MLDIPITTFHVVNLGCKVNRVESDAVSAALVSSGARQSAEETADLIVVNTCTVTGEAEKKARKAVRHAISCNPHARVIVTGCAVAIDEATYAALGENVEIVQRGELLASMTEIAKGTSIRMGDGFRTRVNVKIQDGCDHACTYCIVHVARGRARSVPFEEVMREARNYLELGAKEIVLAGIDLASYKDGDIRLAQLVESLLEAADKANKPGELPARVRASSIEPHTLDESLIDLLAAANGRLCRHLHLPLQSGSTKVLREMARPYNADGYRELVEHLHERVPSIALSTDIIAGFPGETDDEFEKTLELARICAFSKIHAFPYSKRAGTPAAARLDQVSPEVKTQRAARLRALGDELRKEDFARRRGTEELVIVEDDCALTESYHEIAIPAGAATGELVPAVLEFPL